VKPPSKAQLWARERNWNKARLKGIYGQLVNIRLQNSTIMAEHNELVKAARIVEDILLDWDIRNIHSKEFFLKRRVK